MEKDKVNPELVFDINTAVDAGLIKIGEAFSHFEDDAFINLFAKYLNDKLFRKRVETGIKDLRARATDKLYGYPQKNESVIIKYLENRIDRTEWANKDLIIRAKRIGEVNLKLKRKLDKISSILENWGVDASIKDHEGLLLLKLKRILINES